MVKKLIALGAVAAALVLTGCTSDADTVAYNLDRSAEQFDLNRRITVTTGFGGEVALQVEGQCSLESANSFLEGALELICRIGPNEYAKHFVLKGDNDIVTIQQLGPVDASVYHHRVLIKPENILPEFDYEAGEQ